jgi:hypothetical protein
VEHQRLVATAQAELDAFQQKNPAGSSLKTEQMEQKSCLEARVEALQEAFKNYDDCGPVHDCLTFLALRQGLICRCCL